ncbi:MAG TPA: EVE domain-containing protein [Alphaproteobacteria bacterium]|nr:EVE domain-containing protein [Alphaproteobacteria bacterium]
MTPALPGILPPPEPRHWIGVAARDHVLRGVAGGFCQLCHGKAGPLRRLRPGDWIAYYSGVESFGGTAPCQRFTAIGRVAGAEPYAFDMGGGFVPWRRDIDFLPAREAPIRPLIDALGFLPDKRRWGYPFRFGHLEVPAADFRLIAAAMGVALPDAGAAAAA